MLDVASTVPPLPVRSGNRVIGAGLTSRDGDESAQMTEPGSGPRGPLRRRAHHWPRALARHRPCRGWVSGLVQVASLAFQSLSGVSVDGLFGACFTRFAGLPSASDVHREVLASERGSSGDEVGGRAFEDDPAAVVAGAGAKVDDPVGVRHDRLVVLDHDD